MRRCTLLAALLFGAWEVFVARPASADDKTQVEKLVEQKKVFRQEITEPKGTTYTYYPVRGKALDPQDEAALKRLNAKYGRMRDAELVRVRVGEKVPVKTATKKRIRKAMVLDLEAEAIIEPVVAQADARAGDLTSIEITGVSGGTSYVVVTDADGKSSDFFVRVSPEMRGPLVRKPPSEWHGVLLFVAGEKQHLQMTGQKAIIAFDVKDPNLLTILPDAAKKQLQLTSNRLPKYPASTLLTITGPAREREVYKVVVVARE